MFVALVIHGVLDMVFDMVYLAVVLLVKDMSYLYIQFCKMGVFSGKDTIVFLLRGPLERFVEVNLMV